MAFVAAAPARQAHGGRLRADGRRRGAGVARRARPCVRMVDAAGTADEGADGDVIDVSAQVRTMSTEELKRELYMLCGSCDRGFRASPAQRAAILDIVGQLEESAPCEAPCSDSRLLGDWALVYTNALDVLSLALLGPLASVSGVFQNVLGDGDDLQVVNVVELEPPWAPFSNAFFDRSVARLQVFSKGIRSSPKRIDIRFEKARLRQESVAGYDVPAPVPALEVPLKTDVGYIDTTFLDDEFRVARAPASSLTREGGVFVLRRVMDSASGYG